MNNEKLDNIAFFNPNLTLKILIASSCYITSYEVLKSIIIYRVKTFFVPEEINKIKNKEKEKFYEKEMKERNKNNRLIASMIWLKENNIFDDGDNKKFDIITELRNDLAHRLHYSLLPDGLPKNYNECFEDVVYLTNKFELQWWNNFEYIFSGDEPKILTHAEIKFPNVEFVSLLKSKAIFYLSQKDMIFDINIPLS